MAGRLGPVSARSRRPRVLASGARVGCGSGWPLRVRAAAARVNARVPAAAAPRSAGRRADRPRSAAALGVGSCSGGFAFAPEETSARQAAERCGECSDRCRPGGGCTGILAPLKQRQSSRVRKRERARTIVSEDTSARPRGPSGSHHARPPPRSPPLSCVLVLAGLDRGGTRGRGEYGWYDRLPSGRKAGADRMRAPPRRRLCASDGQPSPPRPRSGLQPQPAPFTLTVEGHADYPTRRRVGKNFVQAASSGWWSSCSSIHASASASSTPRTALISSESSCRACT